ncbi:MAG: hypothetical protein QNJ36_11830 [Calothrix sp. MO_167.B42]|nr:hypothetical protein [Calothrix sp. MO_167.B42]
MLETLFSMALEKSLEILLVLLLEKFWKWILNNSNLQNFNYKNQIILFYLHWLLYKTSPIPLSKELHEDK